MTFDNKASEKQRQSTGGVEDSLFMRACRREAVARPPVWLMRQAGRYLPEYQAIRNKVTFLELCKNPILSAEVMLATVDRLGVDAAIIFSDLLPILQPMGLDLEFAAGEGPVIHNPLRSRTDLERFHELVDVDPLGSNGLSARGFPALCYWNLYTLCFLTSSISSLRAVLTICVSSFFPDVVSQYSLISVAFQCTESIAHVVNTSCLATWFAYRPCCSARFFIPASSWDFHCMSCNPFARTASSLISICTCFLALSMLLSAVLWATIVFWVTLCSPLVVVMDLPTHSFAALAVILFCVELLLPSIA